MPLAPDPATPRLRLDQSSVEELNAALRLYRRLVFELLAFLLLGPVAMLGLIRLSYAISPPYGVYILGWDLITWGLLALLALLFGLFWWRGRQIGTVLQDPEMMATPISALLYGTGVIAERAKAMGMEWRGLYGPLRPSRKAS